MSRSNSPTGRPSPTPLQQTVSAPGHRTTSSESDLQLSTERTRLAEVNQERQLEGAPISMVISREDVALWLAERTSRRRLNAMQDDFNTQMRRSTSSRGTSRLETRHNGREPGVPIGAVQVNRRPRPDSPMGPRPAPGSSRLTGENEEAATWSVDLKTMKFSFPPLASVLAGSRSSYQPPPPLAESEVSDTPRRDKGKRKAVDYSPVFELEYEGSGSGDEQDDDGFDRAELELALQLSAQAALPNTVSSEGVVDQGEGSSSPIQERSPLGHVRSGPVKGLSRL